MEKGKVSLTRKTRELIKTSIDELPEAEKNNSNKICEKMAETLCEKHTGGSLEYQLDRMGIPTTGKMLEKIEFFFILNSKPRRKNKI